MAVERSGIYGTYYGSLYSESSTLSTAEMQTNANYIRSYLSDKGWTVNAIAGILGNMQHESAINAGRWQSDIVGNTSGGYGLVQWTPASNFIEWCEQSGFSDPSTMDANIARILYELDNNIQYYETGEYPETFREFTKSLATPYYLACAFAWNYERSYTVLYGTEAEKESLRQTRGGSANEWYTYLTGIEPEDPSGGGGGIITTKRKKGFNFVLFNRERRMRQWTGNKF